MISGEIMQDLSSYLEARIPTVYTVDSFPAEQPVFIADTNILIDFVERRNKSVVNSLKLLIRSSKKEVLILGTTIYNVAEFLDKMSCLVMMMRLLKKRYSPDYIIRTSNNKSQYARTIARENIDEAQFKIDVLKKIWMVFDNFAVFLPSFLDLKIVEEIKLLEKLVVDNFIQSQDAMILHLVSKINAISNFGAYFLTRDQYILDVASSYAYTLDPSKSDEVQRVLKSIEVS